MKKASNAPSLVGNEEERLEAALKNIFVEFPSISRAAAKFGVNSNALKKKVEALSTKISLKPSTDSNPALVRDCIKNVLDRLPPSNRASAALTCTAWYDAVHKTRKRDLIQAKKKEKDVIVALFNVPVEWVNAALQTTTPKQLLLNCVRVKKIQLGGVDWDAKVSILEKKSPPRHTSGDPYNQYRPHEEWSVGISPVLRITITYWNSYSIDWDAVFCGRKVATQIAGNKVFPQIRHFRPGYDIEDSYVPEGFVPKSKGKVIPSLEYLQHKSKLTEDGASLATLSLEPRKKRISKAQRAADKKTKNAKSTDRD